MGGFPHEEQYCFLLSLIWLLGGSLGREEYRARDQVRAGSPRFGERRDRILWGPHCALSTYRVFDHLDFYGNDFARLVALTGKLRGHSATTNSAMTNSRLSQHGRGWGLFICWLSN